jgi:uncharacterized protein YdaU (DUF1376 family)
MAKDPAFLFYPGDYLGGTMGFTLEMHGAYLLCLMLNFNSGHFSEEQARMICGEIWSKIAYKFQTDSKGFFYHKKIDDEKKRRSSYCESRRWNRSHKNLICESHDEHMETETETETISEKEREQREKKPGRFVPPTLAEVQAYCVERKNGIDAESFIAFYESKGWRVGNQPMKKWQSAIITWEKRSKQHAASSSITSFKPPERPRPRKPEPLPEPTGETPELKAAADKARADFAKLTSKFKMPEVKS